MWDMLLNKTDKIPCLLGAYVLLFSQQAALGSYLTFQQHLTQLILLILFFYHLGPHGPKKFPWFSFLLTRNFCSVFFDDYLSSHRRGPSPSTWSPALYVCILSWWSYPVSSLKYHAYIRNSWICIFSSNFSPGHQTQISLAPLTSLFRCLFDVSDSLVLKWMLDLPSPTHTLANISPSGYSNQICKVTLYSSLSQQMAVLLDNLKTYPESGLLGEVANYGVGAGKVQRWPWNILCQKVRSWPAF